MGTSLLNTGPGMWAMLGVAAAAATLVNYRLIQLPARQMLFAITRALVQMVLVALVISQVSRSWTLTCAFLLLMFGMEDRSLSQRPGMHTVQ